MESAIDRVECVVIGAGVVGLAIARALALKGLEVVVLEANLRIGEETSARSNEVIHAGFLYPAGSLKARLCRPGRDLLYAYCADHGVPHKRTAKLMPAVVDDEIEQLHALVEQGRAAGVLDLAVLAQSEVAVLEPALDCRAALLSPSSGIVDSHALMLALQADAEELDCVVSVGSRVVSGRITGGGFALSVQSGGEVSSIECGTLVNAAGLGAEQIARNLEDYPPALVPKIYFAKGEFYAASGAPPVRHLIVPLGATLAQGGALTLDLGGQFKLGPDLSFVEMRDYAVAADAADKFAAAANRYWPQACADRLAPGYAGIRPRTTGPGEPPGDWRIDGPAEHGIPGLVHLFGIDTPGLTSCLSLADHVCTKLQAAST